MPSSSVPTSTVEPRAATNGCCGPRAVPLPGSRCDSRRGATRSSYAPRRCSRGTATIPTRLQPRWRDGWLHTGDVGRIDPDGLLTIVDRLKDVIVSGGENVASREVEDVLRHHPGVADVAVIGVPDERWGERVTAVVVTHHGASVDEQELLGLCRDHLAGFKTPRAVRFCSELPRNAAGKVLKQQLRAELRPDPGQDGSDGMETAHGQ